MPIRAPGPRGRRPCVCARVCVRERACLWRDTLQRSGLLQQGIECAGSQEESSHPPGRLPASLGAAGADGQILNSTRPPICRLLWLPGKIPPGPALGSGQATLP